ncbi:MAG TPA: hypothetical protein VL326_37705 [Kofleriaceae bacterium]|nr:hypothetical protein [Kofleriaceae bacterium]
MKRALLAVALAASSTARADPLRLRGDALATTTSPAGLLTLEANGEQSSTLSAEALVWMAGQPTPGEDSRGDVLVIALRARDAKGRASATLGRFVATVGALRPVHVDGAGARLRLPHRFDVEAYAGIPVVPGLATGRSWDWLAASRVSRRLGEWGSAGVAFLEQRDAGQLATRELGFDAGLAFSKSDNVAGKVAYDIANPGVAAVMLTATHRQGPVRADVFASHREASHLLPATSLFTVLGDMAAERGGTTITWRAAPRLEVIGEVAARRAGSDFSPELVARARLKLDDSGTSALSGEVRRDGVADDQWTGLRAAARIGLPRSLALSTELEVVIPDEDRMRGAVWPWALVALGWDRGEWHAALAAEASATPTEVRRLDVLGQVGRTFGGVLR